MAKDDFTEVPCDVCGTSDAIEVPHVREYTNGQLLHICKKCGLIYAKNRRSYEKIAEIWSKQLFGDPKVLTPHSYSAKNPHVKSRHTYFSEFIDVSIGFKGKKVCDIGAGEGQFLEMARNSGAEVFGIEPSQKNCEIMDKLGMKNFCGTIEQYGEHAKKNNDSYKADIATVSFTLECTQSPANMLKIAHALLKDGGYVAIHTGSRILVPFKKPLHCFLSTTPVDSHPIDFSFNTLKGLLAVCGFEVAHFNPYIENDNLCVIARKVSDGKQIQWQGDDYMAVADFFERWHKDSLYFYRDYRRPVWKGQ